MQTKEQRRRPTVGNRGENAAVIFLQKRGYVIRARNAIENDRRCIGEIDIIAQKEDTLVLVEVKTCHRRTYDTEMRLPEAQITRRKLQRMYRAAQVYVTQHNLWHMPQRFDAIAITYTENRAQIRHIKNIFL